MSPSANVLPIVMPAIGPAPSRLVWPEVPFRGGIDIAIEVLMRLIVSVATEKVCADDCVDAAVDSERTAVPLAVSCIMFEVIVVLTTEKNLKPLVGQLDLKKTKKSMNLSIKSVTHSK